MFMLSPTTFLYEQGAGVATITLNRPERLNALTFEIYRELTDTFVALREEHDVRVVVITGAGRAFCSGGDVHEIIGELFKKNVAGLLEFTRLTCDLIRSMRALPKPIIASLNGTTAGAGACIALASDLRLASEEAKIAFLFVKVGLAGTDMGASYLLPRVVGLAKATEMLYTGDFVSAAEAERIGLYNRVVPPEQLAEVTSEWAENGWHAVRPSHSPRPKKCRSVASCTWIWPRPLNVKSRPRRCAWRTRIFAKHTMRLSRNVNQGLQE